MNNSKLGVYLAFFPRIWNLPPMRGHLRCRRRGRPPERSTLRPAYMWP